MLLAEGKYADAASEFRSCGMYRQAADAYMKAGDTGGTKIKEAWHEYRSAIKCYDEAGHPDGMRLACEKCWRIDTNHVYDEDIQRLEDLGLLEQFIANVSDHETYWLARKLEDVGQFEYAAKTYAAAATAVSQLPDEIKPFLSFNMAIECGKKGSLEGQRLLELHKGLFRTIIAQPEDSLDIDFFLKHMFWLLKSDNLVRFINDLIEEAAVFLCHLLVEFIDELDKPVDNKTTTSLANKLLQCLNKAESKSKVDADWDIVGGKYNCYCSIAYRLDHFAGMFENAANVYLAAAELGEYREDKMKEAAKCFKKANLPLKAAEVLEQLGEFKEAAGLAEDAGNKKLAIRLYEQALKKKGLSDTEAEWLKMTLKRLCKKDDEPFAAKTKPSKTPRPVDREKKAPKESTETSIPRYATAEKQSDMHREDYKEEPVEQFQGGPYTLTPAKEEDIRWIADKAGKIYGLNDTIPVEVKLFWFRKNPNGFWIIKNHTGKPIGSCELLPLKKDILGKMMTVGIKRREISPDDIYSPKEMKEANCIYIENIMALREDNTANPWAFKECLKKIPHVIDCLGFLSDNAKIYAMPIKEFRTAKGVRRSTSERLLQELGFWKVTKKRKQKCSLYCAELERFLSSSDFYRDGSKKAPERRKGTKSRKKSIASEKASTKFRLWKNPGDACFAIVGNRVKFCYKGELTDLRLKSFGKTHDVFTVMYDGGLRTEDAKRTLCPRNTKPHDFFRNINRELNNKIAKLGISGVPNDVEFIQYLPESREYKFAIPVMCVEEDDLKSEIFDG